MKLKEEKELKAITDEYEKALNSFHHKDLKKAYDAFAKIEDGYKDSEFYSVLEIQTRSKAYLSIIHSRLNPVKVSLKKEEDYLWEGTYQLNAGNFDRALHLFQHIEGKDAKDAYLFYLMGIAYFRKDETDNALKYLGKCVKADSFYKVIIYNEPDFEPLVLKEDFLAIVE